MDITPRVIGQTSGLFTNAKANPTLARALDSVPGIPEVSMMMSDLVKHARTLSPGIDRADVDRSVLDSLSAGNGIPADSVSQYGQAEANERAYVAAESALRDLYGTLLGQRDELVYGGLDTMCRFLDAIVRSSFAEMLKLQPVPTSAEEAIAAGKIAGYKKMTSLRADYFQARAAHRALLTSGLRETDQDMWHHLSEGWPIIAHAASLGAIWPKLPEWKKYGKEQVDGGRMVKLTPPWPNPDSEEFLNWLLAHPDANPWVPTFDAAAELLNQIISSSATYYEDRSPHLKDVDAEHSRRRRMWREPAAFVG